MTKITCVNGENDDTEVGAILKTIDFQELLHFHNTDSMIGICLTACLRQIKDLAIGQTGLELEAERCEAARACIVEMCKAMHQANSFYAVAVNNLK